MRTHLIRDLNLKGADLLLREFPNADSYNLREVTRLLWKSEPEGQELSLALRYQDQQRSVPVAIRCTGVRKLKLPVLWPKFYLSELEIEDTSSSHLEGIRFTLKDYGGDFEVECFDVEILPHKDQR